MSEREQLEQTMAALEAQRNVLGDAVVDASLAALREKLASLEPPASPAQRKQVTILFADIVDSSHFGHQLDPEVVLEVMGGALKQLVDAVEQHQGRVARLMGDGLLAFFGADQTREDDPERAVRAGLAILAAGERYRQTLTQVPGGEAFAVRVGINTGLVALGEVGGAAATEFTAMGDAINLAARLEAAAPAAGLLIAHDTYRHVRGVFTVQAQAPLSVKGFAEPMQCYLVLGSKPRAFRLPSRGVEGIETRLIGRERELWALQAGFQTAMADSETRLITIVGEAGVGKSRLLYEFETWLELRPESITYFKGRATAATQSLPYSLLRDLLAHRFNIGDSDPRPSMLARFRAGLAAALTPERADLVGHLVGFDFSESEAVQALLGSAEFRQMALAYLTAYFRHIVAQPSVILLEDLQWADESSLAFFGQLFNQVPDGHLLIVGLGRPSLLRRQPSWGVGPEHSNQIDLKPLTPDHSHALVREILQRVVDLPEGLSAMIVASAGGNPFYVEELVKMLLDKGTIVRDEPQWRVAARDLDRIPVPTTLAGVLQARLDELPAAEKMVLQRASVVGPRFWAELVAELVAGEPEADDVPALLDALEAREMIFRQPQSSLAATREYAFKHLLLRDAVHETVLLRLRRQSHGLVARWLEHNTGERQGEFLTIIAGHYELAGEVERAADCLGRAGRTRLEVGAAREAQAILARALALLPQESAAASRSALTLYLGRAHYLSGDLEAAAEHLQAGLALARDAGDVGSECQALGFLGGVAQRRGDYQTADKYDLQALALARQHEATDQVALALCDLSTTAFMKGEVEVGETYATEALQLYRELADRRGMARTLNMLGLLAGAREQRAAQTDYFRQALAAFREIGDLANAGVLLQNLGAAAHASGDYQAAIDFGREALSILEELGQSYYVGYALVSLGLAYAATGVFDAARESHCRALRLSQIIHSEHLTLLALVGVADWLVATGRLEDGAELLGQVLAQPGAALVHRQDAEPALKTLRARLPAGKLDTALERGGRADLELAVNAILADCPPADARAPRG